MKIKALFGMAFAASVAFATTFGLMAGGGGQKASVKFENTVHDFGMIKEDGGPVCCEFPFKNEGGGNLIFYEAKAECGCTKPEYPKAPVSPERAVS